MGGFGVDIGTLLEELLAEIADRDLAAVRSERLAAIGQEGAKALDEALRALDELILTLDEREQLARSGGLAPEPGPEGAEAPKKDVASARAPGPRAVQETLEYVAAARETGPAPGALARAGAAIHDAAVAVAAVAADALIGEEEPPPSPIDATLADENLPPLDFEAQAPAPPKRTTPARTPDWHEAPTVVVGAVDDDVLAALADTATAALPAADGFDRALAEIVAPEEPAADEYAEDYDEMATHGALVAETDEGPGRLPEVVVEPDEEPTPGWTRPAELLFDDALRLFRLGDSDGALISLERLLASMALNEDLIKFIQVNEERLLDLYHAVIGPWDKAPRRIENPEEVMPAAFSGAPKIRHVLSRIDGKTSLADIMEDDTLSRLEAIAVVSQLLRAKVITTTVVH